MPRFLLILLFAFSSLSCSRKETEHSTTLEAPPAAADVITEEPATDIGPFVTLSTKFGDIVIELNPERAPATVANFLSYIDRGYYQDTVFHHVVESFRIQGGGFTLDGKQLVEKTAGDPIPSEARNGLSNDRGSIAMARHNDPDSATCQFFINMADNIGLNPGIGGAGYTVFGKVVAGMEVADQINQLETSNHSLSFFQPSTGEYVLQETADVPAKPVIILSAKRSKQPTKAP